LIEQFSMGSGSGALETRALIITTSTESHLGLKPSVASVYGDRLEIIKCLSTNS
jgi:hypothetical protein